MEHLTFSEAVYMIAKSKGLNLQNESDNSKARFMAWQLGPVTREQLESILTA